MEAFAVASVLCYSLLGSKNPLNAAGMPSQTPGARRDPPFLSNHYKYNKHILVDELS